MSKQHAEHIQSKYPNLDITKLFNLFDEEIQRVQINPDNPELDVLTLTIGCDLNRAIMAKVLNDYIKIEEYSEIKVKPGNIPPPNF
jgi:hypothetical protein